jgi:hypothetical protein
LNPLQVLSNVLIGGRFILVEFGEEYARGVPAFIPYLGRAPARRRA